METRSAGRLRGKRLTRMWAVGAGSLLLPATMFLASCGAEGGGGEGDQEEVPLVTEQNQTEGGTPPLVTEQTETEGESDAPLAPEHTEHTYTTPR